MLLLVQFQIMGEISNNLLSEARDQLGLNQTQVMVCLHMASVVGGVRSSNAMTPTEIARSMCCPATRVINQLTELMRAKLVVKVKQPSKTLIASKSVDLRERRHALTADGLKVVSEFLEMATRAEKLLLALIPIKTETTFQDLQKKLQSAIELGAFSSCQDLDVALRTGTIKRLRRGYIHAPRRYKPQN